MKDYRTIKIWTSTYHELRLLAALTAETMLAALERLVRSERERVQQEQRLKGTIPMDQNTQFRTAVRSVLTILLDEERDPQDRVRRATEILLGLPVPMPPVERTEHVAPDQDTTLYVAGADGLPTTTPYVPAPDEGPVTEEEVAIMLRELRGE
jgi:hypothetical protein